jgi:hypothetical protein
MIVAQAGDVLVEISARVEPIAAVRVRLSLVQGQLQAGELVNMAASVGPISAVMVMLSLEHGQSFPWQVGLAVGVNNAAPGGGVGVSRMGVARISKVALGFGVTVTRNRFGPQDSRNNKTRAAGTNKNNQKNFLFMAFLSCWVVLLGYHKQVFCWGNERSKGLVFFCQHV